MYFYPRSPCGERPVPHRDISACHRDFYPRSPCGERHANLGRHRADNNFYPRSPCGERPETTHQAANGFAFLSTLSLRRATINPAKQTNVPGYFYPRSPCGERRRASRQQPAGEISIHALLAESDTSSTVIVILRKNFYPRSPCGERQANLQLNQHQRKYFYPRSPCGERPVQIVVIIVYALFLSTLSLRRATVRGCFFCVKLLISIHALLAESDAVMDNIIFVPGKFLSTLSLRRATASLT